MKACVLIHGAWHGAWCWERLEPYLSGDCKLVIPTLPIEDGNNGINTNVQTIIQDVEKSGDEDIVLVGHSYAGMLLALVAKYFGDKVKGIIFIDAFVPKKGQCLFNIAHDDDKNYMKIKSKEISLGELILPSHPNDFGVVKKEDVKWMISRLRPQSLKTSCEPVDFSIYEMRDCPKLYILCLKNSSSLFKKMKQKISFEKGWKFRDLKEPHDVMITNPKELSNLIKDFVDGLE